MTKVCTLCSIAKPLVEFPEDRRNRDGRQARCYPCAAAKQAARYRRPEVRADVLAYQVRYRKAHPEKRHEAAKALYARTKEKRKADAKAYKAANRERYAVLDRAYRQSHAAEIADYKKRWRAGNSERIRAWFAARRARKLDAGGRFTADDIASLMILQRRMCACCRERLNKYHVDHILPLKLGGTNERSNLQLLCPTCNLRKAAKHPIKFMQERGFLL